MNAPAWIARETVMALQEQLLSSFGGSPGLRDQDALVAAFAKPAERFAAAQASVFALAACYCSQLTTLHPFLDGNIRLGFITAVLFLELNGYRLHAPEADAAIRTLAFAARAMDETDYAAWLQANARRS